MEKLSQFAEVYVVLGNEACDLDSMVSSLVYAFSIYKVEYNPQVCRDCDEYKKRNS